MKKRIILPDTIKYIIDRLYDHGFEAFAVGGCIRDSLIGQSPHDWDVTTSASPDEIKRIFKHTFDSGIKHGTVTILLKKESVEVTTYRIDGIYDDGRHPSSVEFTDNLPEDLRRRDFTINAIAYNEKEGIVDPFHGMDDLARKRIRCVGNPDERFEEDALRIMRAVRFCAQLGFDIHSDTMASIRTHVDRLSCISVERIASELIKMICTDRPDKIRAAYELGITGVILPEFDRMMVTPQNTVHHSFNVGEHTIQAMMNIEKDKDLRLAMLLHDSGKPDVRVTDEQGRDHFKSHSIVSEKIAANVLKRLKLDNDTIRKVCTLIRYHDWHPQPTESNVRWLLHSIGKDLFPDLMKVQRADINGQSIYMREEKIRKLEKTEQLCEMILDRGDCLDLKDLNLKGSDLLDLGLKKGPKIGEILNEALHEVLDDHEKNSRDYLLNFAQRKIGGTI